MEPFAISWPLPFRVLFLVWTGIICFATNLHGLYLLRIDAGPLLAIRSESKGTGRAEYASSRNLSKAAYSLSLGYASVSFVSWLLFRTVVADDSSRVDDFKWIPALCFGLTAILLLSPLDILEKKTRYQFLQALQRCVLPSVATGVYFSDVVLADILTSFAKVLGDLMISAYMLLPGGSLRYFPSRDGFLAIAVPFLMSGPYLVRLRQCLTEYRVNNSNTAPLYNALKYASAFPVIFLSAAQRQVADDLISNKGPTMTDTPWHGEHPLFRMWLLAVAINSSFSFFWDVSMDWGLTLLMSSAATRSMSRPVSPLPSPLQSAVTASSARTPQRISYGLRRVLLFPKLTYYLAIIFNLVLRFTWSLKLSSHLHTHADGGLFIFYIELAETLRRWLWVFFRFEWELIKRQSDIKLPIIPSQEDIALH